MFAPGHQCRLPLTCAGSNPASASALDQLLNHVRAAEYSGRSSRSTELPLSGNPSAWRWRMAFRTRSLLQPPFFPSFWACALLPMKSAGSKPAATSAAGQEPNCLTAANLRVYGRTVVLPNASPRTTRNRIASMILLRSHCGSRQNDSGLIPAATRALHQVPKVRHAARHNPLSYRCTAEYRSDRPLPHNSRKREMTFALFHFLRRSMVATLIPAACSAFRHEPK